MVCYFHFIRTTLTFLRKRSLSGFQIFEKVLKEGDNLYL